MGSYQRSVCVCRARSSSRPLFSALRLQEEDAFLCAPGDAKAGQKEKKKQRKRPPSEVGEGLPAAAGASSKWAGPCPLQLSGVSHTPCSLLSPTPAPDFLPHPLPKPVVSVLPPAPCSLSSTFLRSGRNLPLSLCLLPASSHVL